MRRFVPFLLLLFVVAAILRIDFFFTIVYFLIAAYALSRMWIQRAVGQLHVERRFVDHAFCGDRPRATLTIHNEGWLPVSWLTLHESLPVDLRTPPFLRQVLTLGPHSRHSFNYAMHCRRRGYYSVGPLRLQVGDLLGLARPRQRDVEAEPFVVYPHVVPLQQLGLPTRSPQVALRARTPLFEDPARVAGVRGYELGDSPRRIHWTATASTGQLLVKQYEPSIARETLIVLDMGREHFEQRRRYTATELAVVVAASLAHHIAVNERLSVGLAAEGWDPLSEERARFYLPPRKERAHLMKLLEVLARIGLVDEVALPDLLRRESVRLPWGATLVVIAGQESEGLYDTLVYLRRAGFAVSLVLIQPVHPSEELRRRAPLLGVPVHQVWSEKDLRPWR
ncbi:MAG: DUF58 domain-containing protein [Anaerolineae bacterium]|jgi:uncharacterized protein (DUF58 family)